MSQYKSDCDTCKNPCTRPCSDYYPIDQVRFCRIQMFFLIEHLETLNDGIYPPACEETGYVGDISKLSSTSAAFEAVSIIYCEVTSRLAATRTDGGTLVHEIQILKADTIESLSPCARDALNYISGFRRKPYPYYVWKKERNRKNKIHQLVYKKST